MPKELKVIPNERVDLDDFVYGTSTFSVDSLKDHVHRLLSGDYRGGFVFEGFRVEITSLINRTFIVHNGVAVDRDGFLLTMEDDPFNKNTDFNSTEVTLPGLVVNQHVMIEFEMLDADPDDRTVWDPTFANPGIIDSDNDVVPAPKGKEFSDLIPTRRVKSWKIVTDSSFTDTTDRNTVRVPIAILPVDAGGHIAIGALDIEGITSTVMEKPSAGGTSFLNVANSRIFDSNGGISILDHITGSLRTFTVGGIPGSTLVPYAFNDPDNNLLSGLGATLGMNNIEIGDSVLLSSATDYIKAGSQYDCRPMFFSFTDPTAATFETLATGQEPRDLRFESGQSLITTPLTAVTTPPTTDYPYTGLSGGRTITDKFERAENRMKQKQDFFRAVGTIIREVKYGDKETINSAATAGGTPFLTDTSEYFDHSFVGATLTINTGPSGR